MDKEFRHEKMCQVLKTEKEMHPSLRQDSQWECVESDTESLAQERVYQQQLQMRIDQNKYVMPQKENADSSQQGDEEDENANDDETEDLQVYDSLDVAAHHAKRNHIFLHTEYLDTKKDEREGTSQLFTDDAYSDLRYDPNWRTNLREAGRFNESPNISVEEYYQVPKEESSQSCGERQELVIKGEYRYIVDTSPAVVVTPPMAANDCDQPYRLHPQDGQTSSVTSPHCYNQALQLRSPEADHLKPSCIFTKTESKKTLQKGFRKKHENSCDIAGENICRSPGLTEDIHDLYIQEFKTGHQQEQRKGGPAQTQRMTTSTFPKALLSKKLKRLTEDIVERNKVTLGCNASKCGSYVSVHALKQEMPQHVNKVTQISKGREAQRKEYPNPPQQPPALGVKAERTGCLSSPLARLSAVTQPIPQKTTSSQPLLPTIHLNIELNTSPHLLPLIQQRGQDDIFNLASLHGCPLWSPTSEIGLALSPGCQQTNLRKSSQMSQKGINAHLHHRNLESERTTALKWPLSCEGGDHRWSPNEVHTKQLSQNLPRTPTSTSSLGSGSYTVLPPIQQSMTGKEPELSPGQSVNTAYPVHRCSSDSYLVQMEKQKHLRTRATYKAYSLKEYKQLKSDINLRGLGPDYTAIEKTKMKRQKLYSNVICEQNKKIRRMPCLLAKDPEGNDKKVPRIKALEYAKTIAKPPVQSQPKERQKHSSEGFTEHAPYLEGLDISQLATLEVLRKRHEKEKQTVAHFRKVHAV